MKFSYSAVWEDTVRTLRSHGGLLAALAGVFLFLPSVLLGHFLPQPQGGEVQLKDMFAYYTDNIVWILVVRLVNIVGTLAMLILLLARGGVTVGGSIAGSLRFLLAYVIAAFLANLAIILGLFALVLPGLYVMARLLPLGPAMVAEDRRSPFDALGRSFDLTKGKGWSILGLMLAIIVAAGIIIIAATVVLGSILLVTAGQDVGRLLVLLVECVLTSALSTVLIVLSVAVYRRLREPDSGAEVFA